MEEDRKYNEEDRKYNWYCTRCGYTCSNGFRAYDCPICGKSHLLRIDPKWEITDSKWMEFANKEKRGELTRRERYKKWVEHCEPFWDEVVKKSPDFNQEDFERMHARALMPVYFPDELEDNKPAYQPKPQRIKYTPTITCPYCQSTNTKKISVWDRAFSTGFMGLGSRTIGKEWHCNACDSYF